MEWDWTTTRGEAWRTLMCCRCKSNIESKVTLSANQTFLRPTLLNPGLPSSPATSTTNQFLQIVGKTYIVSYLSLWMNCEHFSQLKLLFSEPLCLFICDLCEQICCTETLLFRTSHLLSLSISCLLSQRVGSSR